MFSNFSLHFHDRGWIAHQFFPVKNLQLLSIRDEIFWELSNDQKIILTHYVWHQHWEKHIIYGQNILFSRESIDVASLCDFPEGWFFDEMCKEFFPALYGSYRYVLFTHEGLLFWYSIFFILFLILIVTRIDFLFNIFLSWIPQMFLNYVWNWR